MKEQKKTFGERMVYSMGFAGVIFIALGIINTLIEPQNISGSLTSFRLLCYYLGHALLLISGFAFCFLPKKLP